MIDVRTKNETEKNTRYEKNKKNKEEGDENKKAKISEEEKNPGIRGNTDAHRKASQGYHHGDNQQPIQVGAIAILRLAALEAAFSRL